MRKPDGEEAPVLVYHGFSVLHLVFLKDSFLRMDCHFPFSSVQYIQPMLRLVKVS